MMEAEFWSEVRKRRICSSSLLRPGLLSGRYFYDAMSVLVSARLNLDAAGAPPQSPR
jgi:hypothetical protein